MKELTVDATLENIEQVIAFADEQLEAIGCPVQVQTQFDIAIDEILSNIVRYAYAPGTGRVSVQIEAVETPPSVAISFLDNGAPFNPLQRADPDVTRSAEEREIGGLGIYMVKKSMDELSYEYRDGQNRLTILKKIRRT